jgi:hypothetical protein
MSPEELTQPTPTPEPAPAPPAPPAPEPPAPVPAPEPEARVEKSQFDAMASRLSRGPSPLETLAADAPREPTREPRDQPSRPAASPLPAPVPPPPTTPDAPKRWAGRYQTPEELEQAYKDSESRSTRAVESAQKLERLLLASLEGRQAQPGQPAAPTQAPRPIAPAQPWDRQTAIAAIKEEAARLGLDDPQADPQRYYHAMTAAILQDPETRGYLVAAALEAMQQRTMQERQIQTLQTAFYQQYPDLREVRPEFLRHVAVEAEARLARAAPDTYGSAEFVKQWFEETAREARQVFRVPTASANGGDGTASGPRQSQPVAPTAPSAKPRGAPFAESPSPRPTEPALTGQDFHLNRVFGRRG